MLRSELEGEPEAPHEVHLLAEVLVPRARQAQVDLERPGHHRCNQDGEAHLLDPLDLGAERLAERGIHVGHGPQAQLDHRVALVVLVHIGPDRGEPRGGIEAEAEIGGQELVLRRAAGGAVVHPPIEIEGDRLPGGGAVLPKRVVAIGVGQRLAELLRERVVGGRVGGSGWLGRGGRQRSGQALDGDPHPGDRHRSEGHRSEGHRSEGHRSEGHRGDGTPGHPRHGRIRGGGRAVVDRVDHQVGAVLGLVRPAQLEVAERALQEGGAQVLALVVVLEVVAHGEAVAAVLGLPPPHDHLPGPRVGEAADGRGDPRVLGGEGLSLPVARLEVHGDAFLGEARAELRPGDPPQDGDPRLAAGVGPGLGRLGLQPLRLVEHREARALERLDEPRQQPRANGDGGEGAQGRGVDHPTHGGSIEPETSVGVGHGSGS